MSIYQLLTPIFALIVIIISLLRLKHGKGSIRRVVFEIVVWGGISFLAVFPDSVNFLSKLTGVKSGINALIFFSILLLFYLVFNLILKIEDIQKETTEIIRKIALKDIKRKKKKNQDDI